MDIEHYIIQTEPLNQPK